ncbi:DNA ligase [Ideonella sp. DXS22W]|uniref:DNA ligase n=1 Tax=Pseudaquabacterium inlustre TaxID=2984192 RepID=A0ABU9CIU7_9BURK
MSASAIARCPSCGLSSGLPIGRRRFALGLALMPLAVSCGAEARAARDGQLAGPLAIEAAPDIDPAGHLVSEKYDGVRAIWDGRTLRFRSGLPVPAPAWWLARLPATPLDGELWLGRGRFEALSGAVRRQHPDDAEWRALRYMVFEQPQGEGGFAQRAARLAAIVRQADWPALAAAPQRVVPDRAGLQRWLAEVVAGGGEGLVLHRADAPWQAGRTAALQKLKPVHDAEAVVLAHEPGRGRLAGTLGALRVRDEAGAEFLIGSGFSDAQRAAPPAVGSVVTFAYRGRTAGGVPRFATFVRERPAGT